MKNIILYTLFAFLPLSAWAQLEYTITPALGNMPNGKITITSIGGGIPPYQFAWSNGATIEDISNLSAGSYTLTIYDALCGELEQTFEVPLAPYQYEFNPYCGTQSPIIQLLHVFPELSSSCYQLFLSTVPAFIDNNGALILISGSYNLQEICIGTSPSSLALEVNTVGAYFGFFDPENHYLVQGYMECPGGLGSTPTVTGIEPSFYFPVGIEEVGSGGNTGGFIYNAYFSDSPPAQITACVGKETCIPYTIRYSGSTTNVGPYEVSPFMVTAGITGFDNYGHRLSTTTTDAQSGDKIQSGMLCFTPTQAELGEHIARITGFELDYNGMEVGQTVEVSTQINVTVSCGYSCGPCFDSCIEGVGTYTTAATIGCNGEVVKLGEVILEPITDCSDSYSYVMSMQGIDFIYDDDDANAGLFGLSPGSYTVTITHDNLVQYPVNFTISEQTATPPTASISKINPTGICNNNQCNGSITVSPSGGTGQGYLYQWSANANGCNGKTCENLCAGSYSVTITDKASGCQVVKTTSLINVLPVNTGITTNPTVFVNATDIKYTLTEGADVRIKAYRMTGELLDVLINGEYRPAGQHTLTHNASGFPDGVYIYTLEICDKIKGTIGIKD